MESVLGSLSGAWGHNDNKPTDNTNTCWISEYSGGLLLVNQNGGAAVGTIDSNERGFLKGVLASLWGWDNGLQYQLSVPRKKITFTFPDGTTDFWTHP